MRKPRCGGIVLAAGASTRMGSPKALLPAPDGRPLAAWQAGRLRAAGCADAVIVLGADAQRVAAALAPERCIVNDAWRQGRCGSLQAGLRALPGRDAYMVLPVDNVLIADQTLRALCAAAVDGAARPWHGGRPGRVVRLDAAVAAMILAAPPDARVDDLLAAHESRLPAADAGAASNINTPEEWLEALKEMAKRGAIP